MIRFVIFIISLILAMMILSLPGCEKEKIVESTEYVHDIERVELPADTVYRVDTVIAHDSDTVQITDTVVITDTIQGENVYDTVEVVVIDTVETVRCEPNGYLAVAALQFYSDQIVLEFIDQNFGIDDGWVFYLSTHQLSLVGQSVDVYDIYGYIDYWTPDWSGFYPLEFYWRVTYTGGDPADVDNWQLSEPPSYSTGIPAPGVKLSADGASNRRMHK